MAKWTLDDLKEKAPDRKAFAAAKKLASPPAWKDLGKEGHILWGNAIGSSGDTYAVHVDTNREELNCSCPSRKRPCKHTLAILIMDAEETFEIPEADVPGGHRYEAEIRYQSSWE